MPDLFSHLRVRGNKTFVTYKEYSKLIKHYQNEKLDNFQWQVIEGLEILLKDIKMYMAVGDSDTVDNLELNRETIGVQTGHPNFKGILGKRFADLGGASILVTLLLARFHFFFN